MEARIHPLGNIPAGFECIVAKGDVAGILSMVWLVPGGLTVYVHAVCTLENSHTDEFWERTVERLQQHLRSAKGVSSHPDMALSYNPSQFQERPYVQSPHGYEGTRNAEGTFDLRPCGEPQEPLRSGASLVH